MAPAISRRWLFYFERECEQSDSCYRHSQHEDGQPGVRNKGRKKALSVASDARDVFIAERCPLCETWSPSASARGSRIGVDALFALFVGPDIKARFTRALCHGRVSLPPVAGRYLTYRRAMPREQPGAVVGVAVAVWHSRAGFRKRPLRRIRRGYRRLSKNGS